ncbi:MAG TPA: anaerobic sulfatase maturase [Candidatus Limnocylindrales bacterium]|nr:anaerobic sulfatase maturase [Candidatus Limnocylindrales bacterium]
MTDSVPSAPVFTAPPRFHVMAKPTGAICNLACTYCFFLDKEAAYAGSSFRMSDETLEAYVRGLIDAHRSSEVTFAWQGGEPTLMGIDFFRRGLELQRRYARPGMTFENTIQTNGTRITREWAQFLAEEHFLVGISIDGPQALHDGNRVDKGGNASWEQVMHGLRLLQEHGVEYNVLTTVNRLNGDYPLEVYRFLRDDVGATWLQFIPVVERVDEMGRPDPMHGRAASPRSVGAEPFGRFLATIWDEWVRNDVGRVYVQTFEAAIRNHFGAAGSGLCVFNETCGAGFALEHNGDLYSCDHFVEPEHRLGNIRQLPMLDMAGSAQQIAFGAAKRDTLPRMCRDCDVRFACHGECPKNRFLDTPDGEPGLNYLCAGYMRFFRHIDRPAKVIVRLLKTGREAQEVMPLMAGYDAQIVTAVAAAGRNDPCPCGSGQKVKRCHGEAPAVARAQLPVIPLGTPRPPVVRKGRAAGVAEFPEPTPELTEGSSPES